MLNLKLINIVEQCNAKLVVPEGTIDSDWYELRPEGVVLDSREVKEGFVFAAYKGERSDGHDYITDVIEKGASAVICQQLPEKVCCPCLVVEDTLQAVKTLAAYYRSIMNVKIVGIVGSVGKTSTKEYVASVLARRYKVLKGQGNHNNLLGLSLEILRLTQADEMAVLEMGISDFGEMDRLADLVRPHSIVFTNIGECHLEFLGDRDGVLKAKTECLKYLDPTGFVVINAKDDKLCTIEGINGKKPYRVGTVDSDVYADGIHVNGVYGTDFVLHIGLGLDKDIKAHTMLPGAHMVLNAMEAAAVGALYGLNEKEIADGIEAARSLPGRSNLINTGRYIIVDDCYNANGASMKAAIDLLKTANGRKVAILGDMYELGERSKDIHEQTGRYAVSEGIEVLLCVGKNCEDMYRAAMSELMCEMQQISYFKTNEELLERLPSIIEDGDTILVKASHGMNFAQIVDHLKTPDR